MNEKERLIVRIFELLELIENTKNQPILSQIRGLLEELRNSY